MTMVSVSQVCKAVTLAGKKAGEFPPPSDTTICYNQNHVQTLNHADLCDINLHKRINLVDCTLLLPNLHLRAMQQTIWDS